MTATLWAALVGGLALVLAAVRAWWRHRMAGGEGKRVAGAGGRDRAGACPPIPEVNVYPIGPR